MEVYSFVKGAFYWLLTIITVAGNLGILTAFALIASQEHQLTKAEGILVNLAVSNIVACLSRLLPAALYEFGHEKFDDTSCTLITLAYRMFRSMSVHLTCLLSCFHWATVNLPTKKQMVANSVCPLTVFLFLMNAAIIAVPVGLYSDLPFNSSNSLYTFNPGFCTFVFPSKLSFEVYGTFNFSLDLIFVATMSIASCHLLLTLHRHRQRMKGLRGPDQRRGPRAESQAAKMVINLVSTYAIFYGIDNSVWIYQIISKGSHVVIIDMRILFSMCYSAVYPIILTVFNKKIQNVMVFSKVCKAGFCIWHKTQV
ncbi:olfactory receptor class A-like protein 1 [Ambystoma mexicanum]|uniref:olfactory receptor class A-like protein 1 n=1 Tax=Ambystoma mexicanum TaxID=8296 RepID=UPI0037E986EA